jgi:hypothetical protein
MSRRKQKRRASTRPRSSVIWFGLAAALITALVVILALFSEQILPGREEADAASLTPEVTATTPSRFGYVGHCQRQPFYIQEIGMGERPLIGTSVRGVTGFAVVNPQTGEVYQDPSWGDAGHLGPYAYTETGDFYVGPAPHTSLEFNPPEKQNILYRIDSRSARMSPLVDLPSALPVSANNPFGLLGIFYDCDTGSLYVSSVAGSTPTEEAGQIFHVKPDTGEIADQLEGIDAFGVGVFNTAEGKRLYFGKARTSELYSVALDGQGSFEGEPRLEFSTTAFPGGDNRKIRRIVFTERNEMLLYAIDFDFTLRAASVIENTLYRFIYDRNTQTWEFADVEREQR